MMYVGFDEESFYEFELDKLVQVFEKLTETTHHQKSQDGNQE